MRQGEAFITTRHENETAYIGAVLGGAIARPMVIALHGELGTGKTVLVRGAAAGLGVTEPVSSPTFVLFKIYRGRLPLYHFDFYRLREPEELEALGFDEFMPGEGVAFVEWAGHCPELLPRERLDIFIERFFDHAGEGRQLWFAPQGRECALAVEKLIESVTWRVNGKLNMIPLGPDPGEAGGRLDRNC
jgi:tRNA threonylcarbamoyladenosine biosynthesis protein TsaE